MIADKQRLKKAIQSIAKTAPEIRNVLNAAQSKGGKASSAGVGVSDAERDRICCDGSTSGSANPGTEEREVGDSQSGLDSNDPADIGGGDGTLSGVTDCETGEPICFDGAGFIPPDGWDAPDDPPIDPEYEEGIYYTVFTGGDISYEDFQTPGAAATAGMNSKRGCDTGGCVLGSYYKATSDTWIYNWTEPGGQTGSSSFVETSCSANYEPICDDPPPTPESWPSDGCTNLIVKDGAIVGSKYDPENDGSYSAPRDSIDLCDGNGNQISLSPSGSSPGGWKTINSTTNNGYLYDSSGRQIAHIDGNQYSDPTV